VVELHGSGLSAEQQICCSGFHSLAEQHGFVVATARAVIPLQLSEDYPPGYAWNVPGVPLVRQRQTTCVMPDDIGFIRDLIGDVRSRLPIDQGRVYVVGFSGGGRLASYLAFLLSDIVAAIGTVSGLRILAIDTHCAPCPIIAFHGELDQLNPFDGGAGDRWREPVVETTKYLALAQDAHVRQSLKTTDVSTNGVFAMIVVSRVLCNMSLPMVTTVGREALIQSTVTCLAKPPRKWTPRARFRNSSRWTSARVNADFALSPIPEC
jgi:poly(3-hydroxybutyrate) depolymerase